MEKLQYRTVMKSLQLKSKTSTEIKAKLDSVYGDAAPSFMTVKIVINGHLLTLKKIAEAAGISDEQAHQILHEELGIRKLSARWVPYLLTVDSLFQAE